jgi:hypothetical protein
MLPLRDVSSNAVWPNTRFAYGDKAYTSMQPDKPRIMHRLPLANSGEQCSREVGEDIQESSSVENWRRAESRNADGRKMGQAKNGSELFS